MQDLVAHAKTSPGKLNVGIPGASGELAGDSLWAQPGLKRGMFAPANTSRETVQVFYRAIAQALRTPDIESRYDELGLTAVRNTREPFSAVVKRDLENFRKLIAATGIEHL
jgi:tripartite-type tricarboxylate transporter receptor subunit TctC